MYRTPFFDKLNQTHHDARDVLFAPVPLRLRPFHEEPRNMLAPNLALSNILPEEHHRSHEANILATLGVAILANHFGYLKEFIMTQIALWSLALLFPKMGIISKDFSKHI